MRGVYAITDGSALPDLKIKVEAALAGGARILQYRDKSGDDAKQRTEAEALLACCKSAGIPLIINDNVLLAAEIGADGVHIGRDDGELEQARSRLGDSVIIGVSCYNDVERAVAAEKTGADYVAFGRFFPSCSKPGAVQAEISMLDEACRRLTVPIVTIGGITADNAAPLIEHGADMIAIIDGIFGSADIAASTKALTELFQDPAAD